VPGECRDFPPSRWREDLCYLRGIDLFNGGAYWEAHEIWEQRWRGCGDPAQREFLRALIQLAAARLKGREGNDRGRELHLAKVRRRLAGAPAQYMGLVTTTIMDNQVLELGRT
jgi:predicted metal-dependent hydrolase